MASPLTLRLDEKTRLRIAVLARRRKTSTSQVLRQAITNFLEREEGSATAYEAISDLIGAASGADPSLSQATGQRLSALLRNRNQR